MKSKFLYVLIFLLSGVLGFSSCSDDDDPPQPVAKVKLPYDDYFTNTSKLNLKFNGRKNNMSVYFKKNEQDTTQTILVMRYSNTYDRSNVWVRLGSLEVPIITRQEQDTLFFNADATVEDHRAHVAVEGKYYKYLDQHYQEKDTLIIDCKYNVVGMSQVMSNYRCTFSMAHYDEPLNSAFAVGTMSGTIKDEKGNEYTKQEVLDNAVTMLETHFRKMELITMYMHFFVDGSAQIILQTPKQESGDVNLYLDYWITDENTFDLVFRSKEDKRTFSEYVYGDRYAFENNVPYDYEHFKDADWLQFKLSSGYDGSVFLSFQRPMSQWLLAPIPSNLGNERQNTMFDLFKSMVASGLNPMVLRNA